MMKYTEEKRDLFSLPEDNMLVHCISSDFAMGAGIAKMFRDRYKVKDTIRKERTAYNWHDKGYCIITDRTEKCKWLVANLVTKYICTGKPTYKTLKDSLHDLKEQLQESYPECRKIGMPLIGCGLDRLKWENVSEIIKNQFADTDIEIVVCRL